MLSAIEYRRLLRHYIAHVAFWKGDPLLDGFHLAEGEFSEQERRELLELSAQLRPNPAGRYNEPAPSET